MQMLMSKMRAAIDKYKMIQDGDKIAVGVSGGKDSLAMLMALNNMRVFYPKKFSIVAITVDMAFNNKQGDFSKIEKLCKDNDIEYVVKRTQLYDVIFNQRKEKNPCSLCAKMRRGLLHDAAKEQGCNKIALGHHLDDAVVTFYMNLLQCGTIGCFSPMSYLSRKDLTLIRPMVFAYEKQVVKVADKLALPVIKSDCPADGQTQRKKVQDFVDALEKQNGYSAIYEKTLGALQRAKIDGWGIE
ncbi:MAG: tRNA 2-thiocytidine biosynthesis TtcA family protein [Acutalibacteraceae bacterium]|nr:tRNA 2-thiocytidine biosynthesis TtcA family protein [Acutalibacteraceae bacterium]